MNGREPGVAERKVIIPPYIYHPSPKNLNRTDEDHQRSGPRLRRGGRARAPAARLGGRPAAPPHLPARLCKPRLPRGEPYPLRALARDDAPCTAHVAAAWARRRGDETRHHGRPPP